MHAEHELQRAADVLAARRLGLAGLGLGDHRVLAAGARAVDMLTKESEGRNRFHYRMMTAGYGRIDFDYVMALYHTGGEVPEGDFAEITARCSRSS